jgi:hypothetical protein
MVQSKKSEWERKALWVQQEVTAAIKNRYGAASSSITPRIFGKLFVARLLLL